MPLSGLSPSARLKMTKIWDADFSTSKASGWSARVFGSRLFEGCASQQLAVAIINRITHWLPHSVVGVNEDLSVFIAALAVLVVDDSATRLAVGAVVVAVA